MLTREDVIPLFLAACPDLRPDWERECRLWYEEMGIERPNYHMEITPVNEFLLNRAVAGVTACLPAAFAALERLLAEGDDGAQDLAATGIIEGLQNRVVGDHVDTSLILRWLGPKSRQYWDAYAEWATE